MSERRTYTKEFKDQVLEVIQNTPKKLSVVAKEFDIAYQTLLSWKRTLETKSQGNASQRDIELSKLQQEMEILRKENEILKKAATFFAKQLG